MTPRRAEEWIAKLGLQPHPEGGYYRETYRAGDRVQSERHDGPRAASTLIYFLLTSENFSSFHRLKSDELWLFHTGSPLTIHVIDPDGTYRALRLGADFEAGQSFQAVVEADRWFGSTVDEPDGFALVGCAVAPGFEFADFELADRAALTERFPQHAELIARLTRV